jgi:translation initiation factor IF-2
MNREANLPVRIYALAKELKLDSGELSEICAKAGITGKGSALASLEDDEVAKLKEYLQGGGRKETAAKTAERGSTARQIESQATSQTLTREDYIAPGGAAGGKPRVLETSATKPLAEKKNSPPAEPKPIPEPAIRLAPVPTAKQPETPAADTGPAPQKPDLKLPADAIRGGKVGAKPLSEHLRKHEKKKTPSTARPTVGAKPPASAAEPPTTTTGRDKGRRKSKEGTTEKAKEGDRALLGGREARQLSRKKQARTKRSDDDDQPTRRRSGSLRRRSSGVSTAAPRKGKVAVELPCTVRTLSEALGVPAVNIQRQLMAMEKMTTINTALDAETIEMIALEMGAELEIKQQIDLEDQVLTEIADRADEESQLVSRPPVVTFLGHVDHGKTSLLDKVIGIDVVSGESGGITQHIRAYDAEKDGRRISFVDTPGHQAFTEMRARGANVTDIAVLVIAVDDGVMPQTEEAISHARAAEVPIVVALNKIDLPGIDENRIMQQLAANELLPRDWGGETELIRTSAMTGDGIDDLLEMLLFIAEDHDYQANPSRAAMGTCLESQLHEGRGVVSKFIVQNGTLRVGDNVVCGNSFGRVKAMYNTLRPREQVEQAGPSTPVDITGLDTAPAAGERFYVLDDIAQARQIAENREDRERNFNLAPPVHVTLEGLFDRLGSDEVQTLNLILRADVRGSLEAIQQELEKLDHPEVRIKVLQATVGGITEADVYLADASDAVICGFNVVPDEGARQLADAKGVQVRRYEIIYNLTDDLKAALEGMLKPAKREQELGRALVQQTFKISRVGTVAGCRVMSGNIQRNARARVIRDSTIVGDYPLDALKHVKDDVKDVRQGMECGIKLGGFNDVKEGDIFEVYKIEEVARTLES